MAKHAEKTDDRTATEVVEHQGAVATFNKARLPYHDAFVDRFDVDRGQWKVLTDAIFPSAKTVDAIVMALSYCKARKLDIFKRVVNIVPMYDSKLGREVETVWPGLAEVRITAHRTGQYAGIDECAFGDEVDQEFRDERDNPSKRSESKTVTYPEWAQYTVYRLVQGVRCAFVGPKVYWLEAYADAFGSGVPNKMWSERARGQIDKVAEVAALRRAFPEEVGNMYVAEEMEGRRITDEGAGVKGFEVPAEAAVERAKPPKAPQIAQAREIPMEKITDDQREPVAVEEADVIEETASPLKAADKPREKKVEEAGPVPDAALKDGKVVDFPVFADWVRRVLEPAKTYDDLEARWEARVADWRDNCPEHWWKFIVEIFNDLMKTRD